KADFGADTREGSGWCAADPSDSWAGAICVRFASISRADLSFHPSSVSGTSELNPRPSKERCREERVRQERQRLREGSQGVAHEDRQGHRGKREGGKDPGAVHEEGKGLRSTDENQRGRPEAAAWGKRRSTRLQRHGNA